jgi:hypothetical protein
MKRTIATARPLCEATGLECCERYTTVPIATAPPTGSQFHPKHEAVAEAAVVGRPEESKGEEIVAFVTLEDGYVPSDALVQDLKQYVVATIGAIARPSEPGRSEGSGATAGIDLIPNVQRPVLILDTPIGVVMPALGNDD